MWKLLPHTVQWNMCPHWAWSFSCRTNSGRLPLCAPTMFNDGCKLPVHCQTANRGGSLGGPGCYPAQAPRETSCQRLEAAESYILQKQQASSLLKEGMGDDCRPALMSCMGLGKVCLWCCWNNREPKQELCLHLQCVHGGCLIPLQLFFVYARLVPVCDFKRQRCPVGWTQNFLFSHVVQLASLTCDWHVGSLQLTVTCFRWGSAPEKCNRKTVDCPL